MCGVGTKPKPLLSIEVSSLVRVQEDGVPVVGKLERQWWGLG